MGPAIATPLIFLGVTLGVIALVFLSIYVLWPLARGLGWLVMSFFRGVGWIIAHLFEFVAGTIGDVFRLISTIPVLLLLAPITLGSVAFGRWSAAGHYARSTRRELAVAGQCLYRACLRRPLKLVWLHGLLEGVEQRVPEAIAAAPGRDRPSRRNQFDGYTITGSLPSGGSGAKLYVADPKPETAQRIEGLPDRVVIKSFVLEEGSNLPQIVRESRALESAKRLGAVFEHGMDERRFWYVMPFHEGDHLGVVTRHLHASSADTEGLDATRLGEALRHVLDLAQTLHSYHAEGLWHKDVKPENVIVTREGAKLVDLGLVTPLRSAMTLTTHGTEYFRDPELVRQALRGVKVHQVDGAKFDVFALGAVLYFVVENDFPAHGALSRFRRKSPEAVKWIIRRAMADYSHRYATTAAMLNDLKVVAQAKDPFAVRPADLPSVGGSLDESMDDVIADAGLGFDAGTPMPPPPPPGASRPPRPAVAAGSGRPNIRRAGLFSSRYAVGNGTANDAAEIGPTVMAAVEAGRRAVQTSGVKARDQVRAARKRAKDMRARAQAAGRTVARERRHAAAKKSDRRRSPLLDGLSVVFVTGLVIGIYALTQGDLFRGDRAVEGPSAGAMATTDAASQRSITRGVAILLPPSVAGDADALEWAAKFAMQRERGGYEVVDLPSNLLHDLRDLLAERKDDGQGSKADIALEDVMEELGLYGLYDVSVTRRGDLTAQLFYSDRPGADRRTPITEVAGLPQDDRALLVVNDHQRHWDAETEAELARVVARYESLGWTVLQDVGLESEIRTVLPIRTDVEAIPMTPALADMLSQHDLAGLLRVTGDSNETTVSIQIVRPELEGTTAGNDGLRGSRRDARLGGVGSPHVVPAAATPSATTSTTWRLAGWSEAADAPACTDRSASCEEIADECAAPSCETSSCREAAVACGAGR